MPRDVVAALNKAEAPVLSQRSEAVNCVLAIPLPLTLRCVQFIKMPKQQQWHAVIISEYRHVMFQQQIQQNTCTYVCGACELYNPQHENKFDTVQKLIIILLNTDEKHYNTVLWYKSHMETHCHIPLYSSCKL